MKSLLSIAYAIWEELIPAQKDACPVKQNTQKKGYRRTSLPRLILVVSPSPTTLSNDAGMHPDPCTPPRASSEIETSVTATSISPKSMFTDFLEMGLLESLGFSTSGVNDLETFRTGIQGRSAEERYDLQRQNFLWLLQRKSSHESTIAEWFNYVYDDNAWRAACSLEDFLEEWKEFHVVRTRHVENQVYRMTMQKKASKAWGKRNAEGLFQNIHTKSMAEAVSKLLQKRVPYRQVVSAINNEVVKRLRRVGRGHRVQKGMIQSDLKNTVSNMDLRRLDALVTRDLGLQVDSGGILCEKGLGSDLIEIDFDSPNEEDESEAETEHA
ncbi:hypothetical protein N7504_006878 [Penicillium tannophilum]|nr:hypothetical protein N7504_006878 [Penicillium tannophilum]